MTPRALFSLLFHADKAMDLVQTALDLGVLDRLDAGPVDLRSLCAQTGARPLRMYKFLDGLESLGLIERTQRTDTLEDATYVSRGPLVPAARAVLAADSIERDRNRYPWRDIHGRLGDVLRGDVSAPFAWPPETREETAAFEASMAAGCGPAVEAFERHMGEIFPAGRPLRWLDVGGGDGMLAASVLGTVGHVTADVYNLADVEPLFRRRAEEAHLANRMGFVAGDFLEQELPRGYDVMSFVRVLHDWPADVARGLLRKARAALDPGALLVVCEEFRDAERLAVQFFWTYFLTGVDACVSRLREAAWYQAVLRETGFEEPRVLPGAFEIVVARRSS